MPRVFLYSDESRDAALFVVAGVAISAHANVIKEKLLRAEQVSGKGAVDWHKTKNPKTRRRYIEEVFKIPQLNGCAFCCVYPQPVDLFRETAEALIKAVKHFSGNNLCVLVHEGFTRAPRDKLKRHLEHRGIKGIKVEAGKLANEPRIRLADALAGFSRLMRSTSAQRDVFSGVPHEGWFLNL